MKFVCNHAVSGFKENSERELLDIFCRPVGFDFCVAIISGVSFHMVHGLAVYHYDCDTALNINVETIYTLLWMNRCICYKIWLLKKQDKSYTVISSSNSYLVEDVFLCHLDRWFVQQSYSDIRNDTLQNLLSLYFKRVYKFTHGIWYVLMP